MLNSISRVREVRAGIVLLAVVSTATSSTCTVTQPAQYSLHEAQLLGYIKTTSCLAPVPGNLQHVSPRC